MPKLQNPSGNRSRRGFTLIELLVVLTIVAILVALVLPSINKAREAARRMLCAANQRSMGVAQLSFESSFNRLPNLKMAHGTLQTLEGQPWSNSSPGVDINANYTGTEEYRILLQEFLNAPVGKMQNGKHIYIIDWWKPNVLDCPSAAPHATATMFNDNFAADPNNGNPYPEFYVWGGFRMDIQPLGSNILYWNGNTPNFVPWRRSASGRLTNAREVVLTGEVCRIGNGAVGGNNHLSQGLNSIWFDGSGGWIPMDSTVAAGIDTWAGGNRFGDPGVVQARIASARWAQLGGGFRVQEFAAYYGNGLMNPAYPDQVQRDLDRITKMGYARKVPYSP